MIYVDSSGQLFFKNESKAAEISICNYFPFLIILMNFFTPILRQVFQGSLNFLKTTLIDHTRPTHKTHNFKSNQIINTLYTFPIQISLFFI